jgi:hypothetical protein
MLVFGAFLLSNARELFAALSPLETYKAAVE